ALQQAIASFAALAAQSTVHAIRMGQGVNAEHLAFFDTSTSTSERRAWLADADRVARWRSGSAGEATMADRAEDLPASLRPRQTRARPVPAADDRLLGGAGDDILCGDVINTDRLPWGVDGNPARPDTLPDGSGLAALETFISLRQGAPATQAQLYEYLRQ